MMRTTRLACACLAFVGTTLGALADASAETLGATGTIRGTVVDADSSAPIVGAAVRLHSSLGAFLASTVTAGDGSYEFVVPAAIYYVFSVAPGHAGLVFANTACATDDAGVPLGAVQVGTTINLAEDEVFVADLSLPLGGGVAGRVFDEATGAPLANAPILLWITNGTLSFRPTDELGRYEFFSVIAGSHHLTTSHTGAGYLDESYPDTLCPTGVPLDCNPASGSAFLVTAGNVTALEDMALRTRVVFDDGFESGGTADWSLAEP